MNILGLKITTGGRKDQLAINKHDQGVKLGSAKKTTLA